MDINAAAVIRAMPQSDLLLMIRIDEDPGPTRIVLTLDPLP